MIDLSISTKKDVITMTEWHVPFYANSTDLDSVLHPNSSMLYDLSKKKVEIKMNKAPENKMPKIKKVIFSSPVTVVLWEDGTKTIVRTQKGDAYDPEKGLAMACMRKMLSKKDYHKFLEIVAKEVADKSSVPPKELYYDPTPRSR